MLKSTEYHANPNPNIPEVILEDDPVHTLHPHARLCGLLTLILVFLTIGVFFIVEVVSSDHRHQQDTPTLEHHVNGREMTFDLSAGKASPVVVHTLFYRFSLNDAIQDWQAIPTETTPLPYLNCSLKDVLLFSVCCTPLGRYQNEVPVTMSCANGQTFDYYSFDARLKDVDQGIQCLVYLNSLHMARADCVLEIKTRLD
jgi:hypothetical protein